LELEALSPEVARHHQLGNTRFKGSNRATRACGALSAEAAYAAAKVVIATWLESLCGDPFAFGSVGAFARLHPLLES
jgi:hypothetical protein